MGMDLAYAGDPASATIEEGERMIQRLAEMVVGEVRDSLGLST
jgi:creatinine amidohydrolase/Fe(II)-dependent formamide hydrolase-like protein